LPEEKWIRVFSDVVMFDNTGKIFTIIHRALIFYNTDKTISYNNDHDVLSSREDLKIQIPEELTGDLTVIVAPVRFDFI